MAKKRIALLLCCILFLGTFSIMDVQAASFRDVPESHWAYQDIEQAKKIGIISGNTEGIFGLNQKITRAEFVSMLNNFMKWNIEKPANPSFTDTGKEAWYYSAVETALKNGAIDQSSKNFRPEENLTRAELAKMLLNALDFGSLAESVQPMKTPFIDLQQEEGYAKIAVDFGLMNGKTETTFEPNSPVTKEEAVSVLMRAYRKLNTKMDFLHGFYAFSSYAQKNMVTKMDAISYGWSRLEYSPTGLDLNVTSKNENEWRIPLGYEEIVNELSQANMKQNLNVYLSATTMALKEDGTEEGLAKIILTDPVKRTEAVEKILQELTVDYDKLGRNPYSGVTIDFENMKGKELKEGFNAFLTELKAGLEKIDKTLYVAVHAKLNTGSYYDAYDYYTIGQLADKVILMAHDYQATTLTPEEMENGFTITPVSPYDQVYYALREITDGNQGVQDKNKIVLAVSMGTVGWSKKGTRVTNSVAMNPSISLINEAGKGGGIIQYSKKYRNPFIEYSKDGEVMNVWYEDSRSIEDKIRLAQMFDINGLSIWRVGLIPDYDSDYTFLDIWKTIRKHRI